MVADVMTKIVSGAQDKRLASRFYNDVDPSLKDLAPEPSPKEEEPIQDTQDMKLSPGGHPNTDKNWPSPVDLNIHFTGFWSGISF